MEDDLDESTWMERSIRLQYHTADTSYYIFEPGNATRYERYEVLFTRYWPLGLIDQLHETIMTVINLRTAMVVTASIDQYHTSYVANKLNLSVGDAGPLTLLIEHHFEKRN